MLLNVQSLSCQIEQMSLFSCISFQVKKNGLVVIQAGSGRGKSSLLFGIRGLAHREKSYTGFIDFKGHPLDETARSCMGLVLQNPHSQMISTLVREELMSGIEQDKPYGDKDESSLSALDRLDKAVELLNLSDILEKPVRTLSAGQKHLIAIAAAGVMNHDLLLMDEPFLYLDPSNIERVLEYIQYLRDQGTGVIVTSHPGIIDTSMADEVVILDAAKKTSHIKNADTLFNTSFPDRTCYLANSMLPEGNEAHSQKRWILLDRAGYGYEDSPLLAKNLSFTISGGREVWLIGENGSGKTTLLNILSGTRNADLGQVIRQGACGSCRIVTITQNPDRHFFESSVRKEMEAVVLGKEKNFELLKSAQGEIKELLSCVGLIAKESLSPFKLSFGEKVFLAAAQAVLLRPDFIFVDDILGFLDEKERMVLLCLLRTALANSGCGLVFTSSRGQYANEINSTIIRLADHTPEKGDDMTPGLAGPARSEKKFSIFKRIFRAFKAPIFEYVAGQSILHRATPMLKIGVSMVFWLLIYKLGPLFYAHIFTMLVLYYLLSGAGIGRFMGDSRFFVLQLAVFAMFMPLFRWNPLAVKEGIFAGIRVWLFFIPVIVMMRTTTVAEWMTLFSPFLSRQKKLAIGVAFGLLPCICVDAGEIINIQRQKGLVPEKKDLIHPIRLFLGLKAVFIPLLILMEDIASLAGLSIKLKGLEK